MFLTHFPEREYGYLTCSLWGTGENKCRVSDIFTPIMP
ncbi:hypothetical protein Poly24_13830 [Rosistilla carotiformis]|uniref:Uncharacterized protein n=1 Tax=Rosistilla carotiformis TaxID=2528017 RepID=A0A518JQ59_9BACT|nr:hypothetical protein Poly24_13830 [Rosistilla carotiformis]